jgi:hypothetical protein
VNIPLHMKQQCSLCAIDFTCLMHVTAKFHPVCSVNGSVLESVHNRLFVASSGHQHGGAGYVPRQTEGLLMLISAVMVYIALILK